MSFMFGFAGAIARGVYDVGKAIYEYFVPPEELKEEPQEERVGVDAVPLPNIQEILLNLPRALEGVEIEGVIHPRVYNNRGNPYRLLVVDHFRGVVDPGHPLDSQFLSSVALQRVIDQLKDMNITVLVTYTVGKILDTGEIERSVSGVTLTDRMIANRVDDTLNDLTVLNESDLERHDKFIDYTNEVRVILQRRQPVVQNAPLETVRVRMGRMYRKAKVSTAAITECGGFPTHICQVGTLPTGLDPLIFSPLCTNPGYYALPFDIFSALQIYIPREGIASEPTRWEVYPCIVHSLACSAILKGVLPHEVMCKWGSKVLELFKNSDYCNRFNDLELRNIQTRLSELPEVNPAYVTELKENMKSSKEYAIKTYVENLACLEIEIENMENGAEAPEDAGASYEGYLEVKSRHPNADHKTIFNILHLEGIKKDVERTRRSLKDIEQQDIEEQIKKRIEHIGATKKRLTESLSKLSSITVTTDWWTANHNNAMAELYLLLRNHIAIKAAPYMAHGMIPSAKLGALSIDLGWDIVVRTSDKDRTKFNSRIKGAPAIDIGFAHEHYVVHCKIKSVSGVALGIHGVRIIKTTTSLIHNFHRSKYAECLTPKELEVMTYRPVDFDSSSFKFEKEWIDALHKEKADREANKVQAFGKTDTNPRSKKIENKFRNRCRNPEDFAKLVEANKEKHAEKEDKREELYCGAMSSINNPDCDASASEIASKIAYGMGPVEYGLDFETYASSDGKTTCYSGSWGKFGVVKKFQTHFTYKGKSAADECMRAIAMHYCNYVKALLPENCEDIALSIVQRNPPVVYCHNLSFDVACILSEDNVRTVSDCMGTLGGLKGCTITYSCPTPFNSTEGFVNGIRDLRFLFKDSYSLIPMPLAAFGESFDLPQKKAPYPYTYFTEKQTKWHIENQWKSYTPLHRLLPHIKDNERADFVTALKIAGALVDNRGNPTEEPECVNVKRYIQYYNELDVEVMILGVEEFRSIVLEQFGVCVQSCYTIGSVANKVVTESGAYKYVDQLSGPLSEFIRSHIRGGYVFNNKNEPSACLGGEEVALTPLFDDSLESRESPKEMLDRIQRHLQDREYSMRQVFDTDVNSLYPYCQGILPTGLPIWIHPGQIDRAISEHDLGRLPWLMCTVEITNIPVRPRQSFIPYIQPDGSRTFCYTMPPGVEKIQLVGYAFSLVNILRRQGLVYKRDFTITSAIYWDGTDATLGGLTDQAYAMRKRAEAAKKNGLASVLKFLLNNIWGKTMQRTYNEDIRIVKGCSIESYLGERLDKVLSFTTDPASGALCVKSFKARRPRYSTRAHVAMNVTERAKLVIFNYAECFMDAGMSLKYSDTDSLQGIGTHEQLNYFHQLYHERHGLDPISKDKNGHDILGGMKSDYKVKGVPKDASKIVWSHNAVWAAPKMYYIGIDCEWRIPKTGETGRNITHHVRLKGVPSRCVGGILSQISAPQGMSPYVALYLRLAYNRYVANVAKTLTSKETQELEEYLSEHKIVFDLLDGGISIEYTPFGSYYRTNFTRTS